MYRYLLLLSLRLHGGIIVLYVTLNLWCMWSSFVLDLGPIALAEFCIFEVSVCGLFGNPSVLTNAMLDL